MIGLRPAKEQKALEAPVKSVKENREITMEASEFKVAQALAATGNTTDLTDREKHLIGLGVVLTRGCQYCTGRRMEDALKAGIPYRTIRAAVDLSAAVNAGVVLRTAIEGAAKNGVDEVCRDDACAVGVPDS